MASKGRASSGAHICLFLGLSPKDNTRSTMPQSRPGRRTASCDIGVVGNPISRRGASNKKRPRDTQQVRCEANRPSTHTVREAWPETAHANSRKQNVVETKNAKPNVFIVPSQVVGEVGLAACHLHLRRRLLT